MVVSDGGLVSLIACVAAKERVLHVPPEVLMAHGEFGRGQARARAHELLELGRDFVKGQGGLAAVLADQTRLQDVPGEQGQQRRAAALSISPGTRR